MLAPGLDFRMIHYIEKRAHNGDSMPDIRQELAKGHDLKSVDKCIKYVKDHKMPVSQHNLTSQLIYFGVGLFVVLLVVTSVWITVM